MKLRIAGLGFSSRGSGFGVWSIRFRVRGLRFSVLASGCRGLELRLGV